MTAAVAIIAVENLALAIIAALLAHAGVLRLARPPKPKTGTETPKP